MNTKNLDKETDIWQTPLGSDQIYLMWHLILCVNLTELRDAQLGGKTLFLGMFVRVFPGEISTYMGRLSKENTLTNASGHHPILWRPK